MKLTKRLAENVVNTKYEALPKEVIERTKKHILDTLGVMFPPSTLEKACIALEEITREMGGKQESTLVGFGGKAPCYMAAFVNGSLDHPLDYDDTIDKFAGHPSGHIFTAALAVAEKVGNVSGKDFVTAVALGLDLYVRLSAAPKGKVIEDYPCFPTTVFGVFAATAAAGRLLRLTADEMVNALGTVLDRAAGVTDSMHSGMGEIRAIRDGFGSREGVLAALMAKKGITACNDGIERFYKAFYRDNYDPSPLISNLGTEFMGTKVSIKPWPCDRIGHTCIKAALDIAAEYNVNPDKIEEVVLTVNSYANEVLCIPIEVKRQRPKRGIIAKLSLPFVMGVVFTKRGVTIEDFFPENLGEPQVLKIASKVKSKVEPQFDASTIGPAMVEVRMQDGRSWSRREDIPYGHPENPISDEFLVAKFKNCARYAKKTLSEEQVDQLVKKILELERVENIEEITKILA